MANKKKALGVASALAIGAGAAYLEDSDKGIISIVQGSIGKKGMVLACESRKTNNIFVPDEVTPDYLYMDGQEVYKFAVRQCPKCLQDYKSNSSLIIKRLDPFSSKKDRCVKCDGLGYDYIVYDKRRAL